MCGLAFALAPHPVADFVTFATEAQRHRGPDAQAAWFDELGGKHVGLGHQRLAIFDLSEAGRQPMVSHSGRMVMVFNGEIYNFPELAQQFGVSTQTDTDSEVALELIEQLGIEEACRHFNGMWAIACLDRQEQRLYLSRDRFGKKPLNYLQHDGAIYGASELKSFLSIPGFQAKPDLVTAGQYLAQSLQNVSERTWIEGICAFPAASTGYVDVRHPERGLQRVRPFWSLEQQDLGSRSDTDLLDEVRELVTDSVRLRSRADVPVAIALSGGLDSSILAAMSHGLAQDNGKQVSLFSVVHPGEKTDESRFVRMLAQAKGLEVDTFSLDLDPNGELDALVRKTNWSNDGPVSSFSPALFQGLIRNARAAGFKVVMTGQGGDEGFCGYRKYPLWYGRHLMRRNPVAAARFLAPFIARGTLLPQLNWREAKRYLTKGNVSVLGEAAKGVFAAEPLGRGVSSLSDLQIGDASRFSVPYLCHYEDRMSMASAVEVRAPFLDYRVMTLGVSLPPRLKMGAGWTKYALRKAFDQDLPAGIAWRKDKMGFSNPEDKWLKSIAGTVREQMGDASAPAYRHGLVNREAYLKQFDRYMAGDKAIWFREVFAPYSLNAWLDCLER